MYAFVIKIAHAREIVSNLTLKQVSSNFICIINSFFSVIKGDLKSGYQKLIALQPDENNSENSKFTLIFNEF